MNMQFRPDGKAVIAQLKVPGISGSLVIFWDERELGNRGYWYVYQTQMPPTYIGIKRSDVINFINGWMNGAGTLLHVPNSGRYRGRFVCAVYDLSEDCQQCAVSLGDGVEEYEVTEKQAYFEIITH